MAESEEELKSLLMKVKEESEKNYLKFNIHKTKIIASGPITSLAFTFLYDPTLTSIHNYWENHSFDHMDLCW